ncbi:MAG: Mur ligase domain-containing protein, partial [Bradymonadaceae bacterium]
MTNDDDSEQRRVEDWPLERIAEAVDGRLAGSGFRSGRAPTGVSHDSRALEPGELFVAIRGENFDGHDFVPEAAEAGARAAIVDRAV